MDELRTPDHPAPRRGATGRTFRCVVIGEGTLPLQCGDVLVDRGHELLALAVPGVDAGRWAAERGIHRLDADGDLAAALEGREVDLVFSIVNPRVLTDGELALARVATINYHDSLLPAYAGVHATSWAIIHGETRHGVTWHEVTPRIDAGRVLRQDVVEIAPDDTALTLNTRCYEAAIAGFTPLVEALEHGSVAPVEQDAARRSYFGRYRRPTPACTLDWDRPAAEIAALVRALDFGAYANAIGTPTFFIGDAAYACTAAHVVASSSTRAAHAPGTVIAAAGDRVVIAARDGPVALERIATLDGRPVAIGDLVARGAIAVGDRLPSLADFGPSAAASVTALDAAAARAEPAWVKRLAAVTPATLPAVRVDRAADRPVVRAGRTPLAIPPALGARAEEERVATLVAALAVYLARVGNAVPFDVALAPACMRDVPAPAAALFATRVPLALAPDLAASFAAVADDLRHSIAAVDDDGTFARTIATRMPGLRAGIPPCRVGVVRAARAESVLPADHEDVTLVIAEQGLSATLVYDRDAIDVRDADTLGRRLSTLLADAVARPDAACDELPVMDAAERELVADVWSAATPWRGVAGEIELVHEVFAAVARRMPSAIALSHEGASFTYGEVERRANQLAHALRDLDVDAGALVGVCLERSPDLVIALLAVLKAGAAYVPLDPEHPADRLAFVLQDARPNVVITTTALRTLIAAHEGATLLLDADAESIARRDGVAPPPSRADDGDRLAYLLYTSGSTGQPKGVMVGRTGLGSFIRWARSLVALSADDAVLLRTPVSFDPSGLEMYTALTSGARLVIAPHGAHNDLARMLELMRRERVTGVVFIPSVLAASADLPGFADGCAALRLVICGGEALTRDLVRRVYDVAPAAHVVNMYGPTEATIAATAFEVPRTLDVPEALPIGSPVPGMRAYVLDDRQRPVPIGVPGELCLGGVQVAHGYLNRPELTADRFVADPFSSSAGARLYRTGDLARWSPDGLLEFLGRADDQVKVRGFRVELGEIDRVLMQYPGVRDCAVVRRGDGEHARLVAYVVADAGNLVAADVRGFLATKLPAYMVPSAVVALDALPLTGNGKLDQRALPEPAGDAGRAIVEPRTATEAGVRDVWAELLGTAIGVEDDVFAMGANSLLATRALARFNERFARALPLRAVFDVPTPAAMAALIDGSVATETRRTHTVARVSADEAPLSSAQELLWLFDRTHPDVPAYNIADLFWIHGALDPDALEDAFADLLARHAALRTSFALTEAGPRQRVHATAAARIARIDLRDRPLGDATAEARRLADTDARVAFDLGSPPLIRATLLHIAEDAWALALVHHHIVSDGWSRAIVLRELGALYGVRRRGASAAVLRDVFDHTRFAAAERTRVESGALAPAVAFWRDELAGAPDALDLPTDHPRPTIQSFEGSVFDTVWPAELRDALRDMSQTHGVTLFMTLLAGFEAVLARYSGQADFVIGTPVGGRTRSDAEGVVGYFANMLPLRADVEGDPSFASLLQRVRGRSIAAFDHQDVPFASILDAAGRGVDPSRPPLFQVMFALQNTEPAELRLDGTSITHDPLATGTAKFDLWLTFTDTPGGLAAAVEYRRDLFDAATIERMVGHVRTLLEAAALAPTERITALPMLTAAEREQLAAWNATERDLGAPTTIHALFEAQAARTPDAVAVVHETERVTYAELDRRANRLARHLAASGVSQGDLVGLCVDRGIDLMVALLAVMKAGAAYVPLDPTYPVERLARMLDDSAPRVVVTQHAMLDVLPPFAARTVLLDAEADAIAGQPTSPLGRPVAPADVAYVIYTSGSTGVPKGAVLPHRAVVNYLRWMANAYGIGPADRVLQKAPVSFDASVWELYLPLVVGASVVLARADGHRDPLYILGTIASQRVTVVQFVPSMLSALLETGGFAAACASVRLLFLGGEALPGELVERVRRVLPGVPMHNLYGPTEAAVYATAFPVPAQPFDGTVPIGCPIANVQVHVLARDGGLEVPVGIPGELFIGGEGVGLGYLNRPDLSAERFVRDPFAQASGAVMYRTGDLARWRTDGVLEFLGRADDQIKIRGFRVELGEIERVIAGHPSVRECAVAVRATRGGEARVVAYVVPVAPQHFAAGAVRDAAARRLPDYMIPTAWVQLETLPLGVTGKLDRRALPEPADAATGRDYVAPRTELESRVARVWSEILGGGRVGIRDDFFELGGHSLLAMRIMLRLGAELHADLPMRMLFDARTVEALAAAIDRVRTPAHPAGEMDDLLAALEDLSDEDAQRLLTMNADGIVTR